VQKWKRSHGGSAARGIREHGFYFPRIRIRVHNESRPRRTAKLAF